MKQLSTLMVFAVIISLFNPAVRSEDVPVLLTNSGFENGLSGWNKQSVPPGSKDAQFEVAPDGHTSNAAKITAGQKFGGVLSQTIKVDRWSAIHIKGYIKTESLKGSAFIECVMSTNGPASPPFPKTLPELSNDNDWTMVEGDFAVDPASRDFRINLVSTGSGSSYFDDISITAILGSPSPPKIEIEKNLLSDGGFEQVTNGSFSKWTKLEGTGKLSVSEEAYEGSHSAEIESQSSKPFRISSTLDLDDSQPPYGIIAMIKVTKPMKAYVTIEFSQSEGKPKQAPNHTQPENIEPVDWVKVMTIVAIPKDVKSINVVCVTESVGTAYFDAIIVGRVKKPGQDKNPESGAYQEYWVENPSSKVKLCVHEFRPDFFDENNHYPLVMALPGGNGWGTQLEKGGFPSKLANATNAIIAVFDPDGRGLTKEGTDDISGPVHQAGLNAVMKFLTTKPYIDNENVGFYTMSFGLILGACTTGRYINDPPIKFIIDWEGPDGHLCPTNHVGRYDMDFWGEREALDFIKKFPGIYIRLQTQKDHAQKTNDHAIRMINAATNISFGGEGKTFYSRVNMLDGLYANPPNKTFTSENPPVWIGDSEDGKIDQYAIQVLKEVFAMSLDHSVAQKMTEPAVVGRNRLGFTNIFGYPKYSQDATKKYFKSLGVTDDKEFTSKVSTETAPLAPTIARIDFNIWANEDWKMRFSGLNLPDWQQIRFVGDLLFRNPGDPIEYARKVSQIVEYFDGDGDGDNPFGVVIKDWQIENEINMKGVFWKGTTQEYASHLINCAQAAKAADPNCKIIMAGEASDILNDTYPKILKALDHKQVFDAVDIHVYSDTKDRLAVEECVTRFKSYLKDAGFDETVPMWMTEYGIPFGVVKNMTANDESQQAGAFAIRTIQAGALGLQGSCYISVVDMYTDTLTKSVFDSMGLVASGMSTNEKAWTKRKIYWTYQRISELFSMVSFENVSTTSMFGDSIKTYKFQRPGLEPIIFAFLANPKSLPGERPQLFRQPFTYYQLVGKDDGISAQDMVGITVLPGEREKEAKFIEDLISGPVAMVMGNTSSLSSRFGVFETVTQDCLDGSSCSQYYLDKSLKDFGTSWMVIRPQIDFRSDSQKWIANDKIISDMVNKKVEPIADISPYTGLDTGAYASAVAQIAERYDNDGLADVFGSYVISKYLIVPDPSESAEDFAGQVLEVGRKLKNANRNATLIIGGNRDKNFWESAFSSMQAQKAVKDKKVFDIFDIPPFSSVVLDKNHNSKSLYSSIDEYSKLLTNYKIGYAKIATMQLSTYTGASSDKPSQTENEQAGELARLYTLASAGKSTLVGWDAKQSPEYQLINSDGTKKLAGWTLEKVSQALSQVKNAGKITPGDEDFGARLFDHSNDGLWVTRFGTGAQAMVIGWIDTDKPPMFSSQDYDLPFSDKVELEYLVPDKVVDGMPVFRKMILTGIDGVFTIPTERFDPFVLHPTDESAEPFSIVLNPPELKLDPGQTGSVKVRILGCDGKISLSVPSTKTLPIEVSPSQPDENGETTLKVTTDSSNKGKSMTVKITANCDNGQQATADLIITVSEKSVVNMTLWVGKKSALVNGVANELAVAPTIVAGKTLVPVRFISEGFGAKVNWDAKDQKIELIFGLQVDSSYTKKVTLWVGKKTAQADYGSKLPAFRQYQLDVPPTIISGTTMVPIRFISDVLGAKIDWDDKDKRIDIVWTPF